MNLEKLESLLELPSAPQEFLLQTDTNDPGMLFREYARYMLDLAAVKTLPVDIDRVISYHGFKQPTGPLKEMMGRRGMQVGKALIVNTDDPIAVQRFSKGHELTEALVRALQAEQPCRFSPIEWEVLLRNKEAWCDRGAAELLLPAHLFFPAVQTHRAKLANGVRWAHDFQISLTATLRRMLDANVEPCILLVVQERYPKWHMPAHEDRHVLRITPAWTPPSELRIVKQWQSPQTTAIVKPAEPVPMNTSIYRTFSAGRFGEIQGCNDMLNFEYLKGRHFTESVLVTMQSTRTALVLIHPRISQDPW
jgi:Zn-dependent peptidase ImmA (M78 family)